MRLAEFLAVSYCPPSDADPIVERPCAAAGLRWYTRLGMMFGGVVLLTLLATAARLQPSEHGMGTHQQLGLPPCTLVAFMGIRCPSCGMTTSWSHMLRGNVIGAVRANSGGTLLALAAMIGGPWLLVSGVLGRWALRPPRETLVLAIGLTIVAVTLIDWCWRLNSGQ